MGIVNRLINRFANNQHINNVKELTFFNFYAYKKTLYLQH